LKENLYYICINFMSVKWYFLANLDQRRQGMSFSILVPLVPNGMFLFPFRMPGLTVLYPHSRISRPIANDYSRSLPLPVQSRTSRPI